MFKIPDQKGTPEQPPQTPRARGARGGGNRGNTSGRFISVLKCYNLGADCYSEWQTVDSEEKQKMIKFFSQISA